jgi:hypothetical protein
MKIRWQRVEMPGTDCPDYFATFDIDGRRPHPKRNYVEGFADLMTGGSFDEAEEEEEPT